MQFPSIDWSSPGVIGVLLDYANITVLDAKDKKAPTE